MMSKVDLQEWLLSNSGFQNRFRRLLVDSVAGQFPSMQRNNHDVQDAHDWNHMLLSASLLAQSKTEKCQDIALRIAQYCMECGSSSEVERHAAAVVLDTLANRLAIKLAEQRNFLKSKYHDRLPLTLLQDWTRRSLENSITLSNSAFLETNKFQRQFWDDVSTHDRISLSAPTSAGKSFIVEQWLAEYLRNNIEATIVYIVPTRALIQQVQRDIENILKHERIENASVATLPLYSSLKSGQANIFVFTQERLHILLAAFNNNISIDMMIIDEAQKIGDGYRGVLLQQATEAVVYQNPKCKIIFASPMTENPEILLDDTPIDISQSTIISEDTMVNQNLIWVSQVRGQPRRWTVELIQEETPIEIGNISLPSSPTILVSDCHL